MDHKEDLTREIEQLAQAIGMKAELLEEKVAERVETVRGSIERTGQAVGMVARAVVPTLLIRSHPWIATGSALLGGFWLAKHLIADRKTRRLERSVSDIPTENRVRLVHAPTTVQGSSFLEKHSGEVRLVRNLVLSALTRYAGKRLRTKLPQFSSQITLAEQAVSTLLH
jgi:ElaB/YqjD/DUF883 family membrane-anchored ribosome-binding protein